MKVQRPLIKITCHTPFIDMDTKPPNRALKWQYWQRQKLFTIPFWGNWQSDKLFYWFL